MSKQHAIRVGDTVLVEQAWEDESGAYHDECGIVESLNPVRLNWIDVNDEVRAFLNSGEFEIEQLELQEKGK